MDEPKPRPYEEWRTNSASRDEDAANTLGYFIMHHCRKESLKRAQQLLPASEQNQAEQIIDTALHNVFDLLEGYWSYDSGPNYAIDFVLSIRVRNGDGDVVEQVEISPAKLDLPVGYWGWVDGKFQ